MPDWLQLIPAAEARRILLDTPPVGIERTSLREAAGRVLAQSVTAPHDLPPARLSAVDGYAVRSEDLRLASDRDWVTLRVAASIAAGTTFAGTVATGEAVGIATGGVIPDGADAVVMVELTAPTGDGDAGGYAQPGSHVRVGQAVPAGANVVVAGEDVRNGTEMLARGRRLRAGDLAALATFGMVEVPVFRRPRIAVLATGSEICAPDQTPEAGQVRDSNQYVLCAEVESAGATAVAGGIVGDDLDRLRVTVARLLSENDGLILSGGSSVGPRDLTAQVLGGLEPPGILFHGIDIRPGKPTVFARAAGKPVVGMPGFPTSSVVVFEAFVRPMLARLSGESGTPPWPGAVRARLMRAYGKPASREDYLRVRLVDRDGEPWAEALPGGSSAISSILFADGLARIPAGVDRLEAGSFVAVRRFS